MSKVTASTDIDNVKTEEIARYVDIALQDIVDKINGNLDFQTNFNGILVTVAFATANANTPVTHNLGRQAVGYAQQASTAAMSLYNGTSPSTSSTIYLKSSGVGTVTILIY